MGALPALPSASLLLAVVLGVVAALAPSAGGEVYLPRIVSDTGTSVPFHGGGRGAHLDAVHHPRPSRTHRRRDGNGENEEDVPTEPHDQLDGHHRHHQHTGGVGTERRRIAYTWGIGGARVGRPSDSQPTPPGRIEGRDSRPPASRHWMFDCGHSFLPAPWRRATTEHDAVRRRGEK